VGRPLYRINNLRQVYRGKTVLSIERLDLPRGGIVGVIGPNGSGKSTFLRLAGFVEKPAQGGIVFNGSTAMPFAHGIRNRVALLPQEPFLLNRSVFKNVAYGLQIRDDRKQLSERVDRALAYVGLEGREFAQRPSYALSGGEAQRVALAARMILEPEVLLLDEPTASIDALSAQLIKGAALRAQSDWGTTLIIASHDWQWLYEVSDTVLHLFKGSFFGTGEDNIVFGPWRQLEDGGWGKVLREGQCLRVPRPPSGDAVAVIMNIRVMNAEGRPPARAPTSRDLIGVISRLALEKASGNVRASVLVAGIPFTVVLSQHQVRELELYPGREVRLAYDWSEVRWV
jgi:tungstate transport system ATP-binding protein